MRLMNEKINRWTSIIAGQSHILAFLFRESSVLPLRFRGQVILTLSHDEIKGTFRLPLIGRLIVSGSESFIRLNYNLMTRDTILIGAKFLAQTTQNHRPASPVSLIYGL